MTAAERIETWDLEDLPELPAPDERGRLVPQFIPDDQIAEDTLRWLAHWYRQREHVQLAASRERARIDELERRQLERIQRRIAWHEGGLRAFLNALGTRSWRGLRGSVSLRQGRERVEVRDEAAFFAWAARLDASTRDKLVRTTVTPSKSGIAAWIKGAGAGEVPDGVEVARGEQTLAVVTSE